jgi:SSS family solute:Na+ symporter
MLSRVAVEQGLITQYTLTSIDPELGLPLLLKTVLPVGFLGVIMAVYFSAIMSTADSCLMASSGNILADVLRKHKGGNSLRYSQIITLVIGALALFLAMKMENVLELMLLSYAFMVSGLLVPVLAGLFTKKPSSRGALFSMLGGGLTTSILVVLDNPLPLDLDPNIFGILVSLLVYITTAFLSDYVSHDKQ